MGDQKFEHDEHQQHDCHLLQRLQKTSMQFGSRSLYSYGKTVKDL